MDAVMGTIGSDVPAHALWRYCNSTKEMHEVINNAGSSDLKYIPLSFPYLLLTSSFMGFLSQLHAFSLHPAIRRWAY
jgi:hypothetical protein